MKTSLFVFAGLSRRQFCRSVLFLTLAPLLLPAAYSQEPVSRRSLSLEEKESFLREAEVIRCSEAKKGITRSLRATLSDGKLTNDASIQRIDFRRNLYQTPTGTHINFRDCYKYNIAAYRLAVMLGIDTVPPSIERRYGGSSGSFTWWVEDVMMDEGERLKRKIAPPDAASWNQQMYVVRVFDQLIDNIDRNMQNLLITKDWRVWMIDHSRAFRPTTSLRKVSDLRKCDRTLLVKLRGLSAEQLKTKIGEYLTTTEIKTLLTRRDLIVRHFEGLGENALYDLRKEPAVLQVSAP